MSYLVLDRLTKRFGRETILDGLSLAIEEGETVAICGPSGCGKTTLLRLIVGIHDPDEGDVLIDGKAVTPLAPDARGIGMAFQNFALYPHMSAFENIASPLRARHLVVSEIEARVHKVAQILKIDHVLSHLPRELSNGQKQRTALCRAIVADASVLLLDDPLRNVDAKLRYEMRHELPRLLAAFQATVLYVTQDFREAMALGHRIGVLLGGRFVQVDRPERVYADPESIDVARLFGDPTINLYESRLESGEVSLFGSHVPLANGLGSISGRDCVVGIRPEHVRLNYEGGTGAIPVTLEAVTPLNQNTVLLLHPTGGGELLASTPTQHAGRLAAGPRQAFAAIDPGDLLIFDRTSGTRIRVEGDSHG